MTRQASECENINVFVFAIFLYGGPMKIEKKHVKRDYYNATECSFSALAISIKRVEALKIQLNDLGTETSVQGISYAEERVQSSVTSNQTETIALNNIRDKTKLKILIKNEERYIDDYRKLLKHFPLDTRMILEMKYFESKSWAEIKGVMSYSIRTCERMRDSSIAALTLLLYGDEARIIQENHIPLFKLNA